MEDIGPGRFEPVVAAIAVHAGEIGEFLRMVPVIHLVIGLVERAERTEQLDLAAALETSSRNDVEYAVGAVSVR